MFIENNLGYERITSKSSDSETENNARKKAKYSSLSSISSNSIKSRSRSPRRQRYNKSHSFSSRSSSIDSYKKSSSTSHHRRRYYSHHKKRSRSRSNSYKRHHYRKNEKHYNNNNRSRSNSLIFKPKSPSISPPSKNRKRYLDERNDSFDDLKRVKCENQSPKILLNQINEITSSTVQKSIEISKKKSKKNEVRRSDRIKHIETKKIHDKETELAEKLKQLNDNESSHSSPSSSSNQFTSSSTLVHENNTQSLQEVKKNLLTDEAEDYKNELKRLISENWPKFIHSDENIYLFKYKKSKSNKQAKRMTCDCSTSEQERSLGFIPCGEDCLNRMLMIECGSRCACDNFCTNKRFQRKEYSFITPFKTSLKGWGLRALQEIKR
jgi:hypothetical protein